MRESKKKNTSLQKLFSKNDWIIFQQFKKPIDLQIFLNQIKYNPENVTSSPIVIIHRKSANCFEGALFAAAVLRIMGYKPLIVDMIAHNDDDHVIAVFKKNDRWGAVAKSNTTVLRFREPVYRSIRELVMSYYDFYFNVYGEKSLRSYSNPVNLSKFDKHNWMTTEDDLEFIGDYLFEIYHHKILSAKSIRSLNYADKEIVDLCFSGAIPEGLFKPIKK